MRKIDLVEAISEHTKLPKTDVLKVMESYFTHAADALVEGDEITIRGFGTLKTVTRAAKIGRNIKARTTVDIPAHRVVKFIPSPVLKKWVK